MLHIIFMILKIIGIVLAVLLGIVLALILIVLFVPFGYQVSGNCDGDVKTLTGEAKVSWLFNLICGYVTYKEKKIHIKARIAWKCIDLSAKMDSKEEKKPKKKKEKKTEDHSKKDLVEEEPQQDEKQLEKTEVIESTVKEESEVSNPPVIEESAQEPDQKEETKESSKEDNEQKTDDVEEKEKKKLSAKIQGLIDKIQQTIKGFCDKIEVLKTKKDTVVDFIKNEVHKRAFIKVKKELIRLLKCLCPKKAGGDVTFGFEDPYTTGRILAGASILYPFYFEHLTLRPDFENQIIKGNLFLKGRIYIASFVGVGLRLLLCKDIRITYKDIRNFKL